MTVPGRKVIGIDARMLFSSGIGTVIQNVIRRLPADLGDYTIIVSDKRAGAWVQTTQPAARIVPVASPIYSISEQFSVARAARGVDLLWSPHYNIPTLFPGRIIVTIHDVLHLARPEFFPGPVKQNYARLMLRAVKYRCKTMACVSKFTAGELSRLTGIESSRIRVIPNGVDDVWFDEVQPPPKDTPYFIFVGNVKPHKNLVRLLQAFEKVMNTIPHRLVIVGQRDGFITGDPDVERYALRLGDRVQFTGWLDDLSLRRTMAQATALVFPSLYEGFGLPILEAMACGCPVLSSSAAALPEVAGSVPLYFNPESIDEIADALTEAATWSDQERSQRIETGRERARLYSWDRSVETLVELFREILA